MRFTRQDGDLSTVEGQRQLNDLLQTYQPLNIHMAPECRYWGSWSVFNASRSLQAHRQLTENRRRDQVHLRLCTRICLWQKAQGRHFHLEQPVQSRMLLEPAFKPILAHTHRVVVDMCAFGLRTPVSKVPIRKRTVILTSSSLVANKLRAKTCDGQHPHQQIAGSIAVPTGRSMPTSRFASSYCKGFAKCMSQLMLEHRALVMHQVPATRKRFKTPDGTPKFVGSRE